MLKQMFFAVAATLLVHGPATAQDEPFNVAVPIDELSTIFTQIYGEDGLIVDSLAALPETERLPMTRRFALGSCPLGRSRPGLENAG